MESESGDERDLLLRLSNDEGAHRCNPAYHSYNEFVPDADAVVESGLLLHFSQDDLQVLLETVNAEMHRHRSWQKISSLTATFGTLVCVMVSVFQFVAGVSLQLAVLFVHVIVSKQLRQNCLQKIGSMLGTDVNPYLIDRGFDVQFREISGGCMGTVFFHLDFQKLATFDLVARSIASRPPAVTLGICFDEAAFDSVVVGELVSPPQAESSPRAVIAF